MALYVMLDVCFRISLTTVWGGRVSRRWYTLILWGSCHQQQRTNMSTNTDWLDNGASEQQIISNACKKSSCHCAVTKCWSIQSQITGRCNRCLIISIIYFGCCRYLASGNCGLSDDKIGNASSIHLSKVRRIVQCWRLGDVKTWSLTDISCVCVFSVPGDVPDAVAAHNNYQMSRCPGHVSSLSDRACATEILRAEHARNTEPTHHTGSLGALSWR